VIYTRWGKTGGEWTGRATIWYDGRV